MIRILRDGVEIPVTYEEFIRQIREGTITADTPVRSEVLTKGEWKPAGQLQFFRSWAPPGTLPPAVPTGTSGPPGQEKEPGPEEAPAPRVVVVPPVEGQRGGQPLPWEEVDRVGVLKAFVRTIRLALTRPDAFAQGIAAGDMVMPSLVFGLLVTAIASVFDAAYAVGAMRLAGPLIEEMGSSLPGIFGTSGLPTARDILFQHGLGILFYPALIFLWGGVIHLLLRLGGRPAGGFAVTLRVANYSMAPQILTIFPVCGSLVGWVWTIVLVVRSLMALHRTGGLGTVAAVLLPLIGLCLWMVLSSMQSLVPMLPGAGIDS